MSAGTPGAYPVRVEGRLDPRLSRWLWLVKWLLAIPHYVVLWFLWVAFAVLSIVAFFAILFTGRYPRGIFDFNVGVLRWTWRVAFYAFAANGTDRYPPFTLEAVDYPATFEVEYPARLSRGLALVKWWLLAIPHYLVLAVFAGGWTWAFSRGDEGAYASGGGLIGLLVFIAVVVLLFTGRYPRGIFDLVLGMNRWVLRVAAYAGLMTDRYPPFRLDLGGSEPGELTIDRPPAAPPPAPSAAAGPTSGGQVVALVVGAVLGLVALGALGGGITALVFDQTQRDEQGFLMSPDRTFSTGSYALVSESVNADWDGPDWVPTRLMETLKIRSDSPDRVFVGIGPAAAVERYLAAVPRDEVTDFGKTRTTPIAGSEPPAAPGAQRFWVARATGAGVQSLRWKIRDGRWRVVVMRADAGRGLRADVSVGGRVPDLGGIAAALVGGGALIGAGASALLYVGIRRRPRVAGIH